MLSQIRKGNANLPLALGPALAARFICCHPSAWCLVVDEGFALFKFPVVSRLGPAGRELRKALRRLRPEVSAADSGRCACILGVGRWGPVPNGSCIGPLTNVPES